MKFIQPTSFPILFLAFWVGFCIYRWTIKQKAGPKSVIFNKLLAWTFHPLAFWSIFNLIYRFYSEKVFTNPHTFPIYANLWTEETQSLFHQLTFMESLKQLLSSSVFWTWGSIILIITTAMVLLTHRLFKQQRYSKPLIFSVLCFLYISALGLYFSFASLPGGAKEPPEYPHKVSSLLLPWYNSGNTMMYAMPFVRGSSDHYLRNFVGLQHRLRKSIHGYSHPPLGSLSLHWIGKLAGTYGGPKYNHDRIRYCIALTIFSTLNLFVMYLLGHTLFQSQQVGLGAVFLWMAMPAAASYMTFAQDSLFWVFFNLSLLLMYKTTTSKHPSPITIVLLGIVFFLLSLLKYNWCIATAIFAVFSIIIGIKNKWSIKDFALRLAAPLGIMTFCLGLFILYYRLDYITMYVQSKVFVEHFYDDLNTPYKQVMSLLGGNVSLLLMMGSVVCTAFLVSLTKLRWKNLLVERNLFLITILAIYLIPYSVMPSLRMESPRIWNWIASVPLVFAAHTLLQQKSPRLYLSFAFSISILSYFLMRLFIRVI